MDEPPFPPLTRETSIRIDREGRFWHDGEPVLRKELARLLASWIGVDPETGRYKIENRVNWCFVTVEDAPLVVTSAAPTTARDGSEALALSLTDGTVELLDPATLRIDADDVPYCDVRGGTLPARFSRQAAFALLDRARQDDQGEWVLSLAGREWPLRRVPAGQGARRGGSGEGASG